jgi:hypothetical protein
VLLAAGEAIEGKSILGLGQPALNNRGQVAVHVVFEDHSEAILLGTPTPRRVAWQR